MPSCKPYLHLVLSAYWVLESISLLQFLSFFFGYVFTCVDFTLKESITVKVGCRAKRSL